MCQKNQLQIVQFAQQEEKIKFIKNLYTILLTKRKINENQGFVVKKISDDYMKASNSVNNLFTIRHLRTAKRRKFFSSYIKYRKSRLDFIHFL